MTKCYSWTLMTLWVIFTPFFIVHLYFLTFQQHHELLIWTRQKKGYWPGNKEILGFWASPASDLWLGKAFSFCNGSDCLVDRKAHVNRGHVYFILDHVGCTQWIVNQQVNEWMRWGLSIRAMRCGTVSETCHAAGDKCAAAAETRSFGTSAGIMKWPQDWLLHSGHQPRSLVQGSRLLGSNRTGVQSQCCSLPAVQSWANYVFCLSLFPHL